MIFRVVRAANTCSEGQPILKKKKKRHPATDNLRRVYYYVRTYVYTSRFSSMTCSPPQFGFTRAHSSGNRYFR